MYYVMEADGEILPEEYVERIDMQQYGSYAKSLLDAVNQALDVKANERSVEISVDYLESEINRLKEEIEKLKKDK